MRGTLPGETGWKPVLPSSGFAMSALKFTYRSGQRPLDGFTLKRGVGQGGSVRCTSPSATAARKSRSNSSAGTPTPNSAASSHCLNLKHPNLVHLYDLRTDARGDHWVVMEYVFGESLAQVINSTRTGCRPK